MPGWRVDYIGKGGKQLSTVEALDERCARAAHSPYARWLSASLLSNGDVSISSAGSQLTLP
jgi:hypothetical protein